LNKSKFLVSLVSLILGVIFLIILIIIFNFEIYSNIDNDNMWRMLVFMVHVLQILTPSFLVVGGLGTLIYWPKKSK
jgi:hypothetical protein